MMKWISNQRIGVKITLAVTALLILGFGVLSYVVYINVSNNLLDTIKTSMENRATENASLISRSLDVLKTQAEGITYRTQIQSMDWAIQKPIMLSYINRFGYLRMGVAAPNGRVNSTDGGISDLSEQPYFKKALQGATVITDPTLSKVDNKMVVIISVPIKNPNGQVIGVLLATLDNSAFSNLIKDIKVGTTGYAFVINKQGTTVAHLDNELVIKQDNDFENIKTDPKLQELVDLEQKMVHGEKGFGAYSYNGVKKLMSYAPIPNTEWSVALAVKNDELFSGIYSLQGLILLLTLLFIGAGAAISIFISRYLISKPISQLVDVSNKLAAGDIEVDIASHSKDEIGLLMSAFQKMVQNTQQQARIAESIAGGDLSLDVDVRSEKDVMALSMKKVIDTLRELVSETIVLTEAASENRLDIRGDVNKFGGCYQDIIHGINNTLDTVVEKVYWYEALLDAVPLPLSVTDVDMNWTFINKPVENFLGVKRKDVIGKQCSNWNANICKSTNCGIAKLRNNIPQTTFEQQGMNFQVDTAFIHNMKGEKIGHIEVVQDITAQVKALVYQKGEVQKLAENLKLLAEGKLKLTFNVAEADPYTATEREHFLTINNYLKQGVETISTYVEEISRVLAEMADGNLRQELTGDYQGDFVEIKNSMNHIIESLNVTLIEINNAATQVAAGSRQVADSSQTLSQGSTEQAGSIEELTASMEQIAVQTKQNAVSANQANQLAMGAKDDADRGNNQMRDMLKAMNDINQASANISKIIKVIDEIAFQTNILALNAAVEAARAGQHGKGFAVVAEEVRNLAARSANAAKETTALIEGSIKQVENGTKMAQDTAGALNKIVEGVSKAAALVGDIAAASNEQATGIAQVNQGINQVSDVTQSNTATSEECAAASEELSSQAEVLKSMVQQFRLKNQESDPIQPTEPRRLANVQRRSSTEVKKNPIKISLNSNDFGKY